MNDPRYTALFGKTLEKTTRWVSQLDEVLGTDDLHKAYMTLRAVLHALRDRLTPEEAVQLGAQLPMLVRGFYYEGWHPANKPSRYRHRKDFFDQIQREIPSLDDSDLEHAVTSVFVILTQELRGNELDQVRDMLPHELRELWPIAVM
jgi:uncharacterized protein (DUF2267 family)